MPEPVLRHLLQRIREKEISYNHLLQLSEWPDPGPEVPEGLWYRRFSGMIVCGEAELFKTFLLPVRTPIVEEVL